MKHTDFDSIKAFVPLVANILNIIKTSIEIRNLWRKKPARKRRKR